MVLDARADVIYLSNFFQPNYSIADPICTFVFSIIVLITTITVLRDALLVLMAGSTLRHEFFPINTPRLIRQLYLKAQVYNTF